MIKIYTFKDYTQANVIKLFYNIKETNVYLIWLTLQEIKISLLIV